MEFTVDKQNKRILVKREFAGPIALVWAAWTDSKILDQWWAPKPWKAETKTMEFKEGGHWIYAMVSPEGEKHWALVNYKTISPLKNFTAVDAFCDENGNINHNMPVANWIVEFTEKANATIVNIETKYDKLSDLESILNMGVKEGLTSALENLDNLISSKVELVN